MHVLIPETARRLIQADQSISATDAYKVLATNMGVQCLHPQRMLIICSTKKARCFWQDPEVKQCRKLIKEWAKNSFSRDGLVELSFDSWCREYGHKLQL